MPRFLAFGVPAAWGTEIAQSVSSTLSQRSLIHVGVRFQSAALVEAQAAKMDGDLLKSPETNERPTTSLSLGHAIRMRPEMVREVEPSNEFTGNLAGPTTLSNIIVKLHRVAHRDLTRKCRGLIL